MPAIDNAPTKMDMYCCYYTDFTCSTIIYTFRENIKKSLLLALSIAFTRAALIGVYAAAWRLAVLLITEDRVEVVQIFR